MKTYKYQKWFTIDGHRYVVRADTMEQLYEKKAAKIQEIRNGGRLESPQMTLEEWSKICVDTYKSHLKDITRNALVTTIRASILKHIGNMRLRDIKPLHCQKCLNQSAGCSRKHITKVNNTMRWLLEKAVQNNLIRRNPAANLELPAGYTNQRRALTPTERSAFEKVTLSNRRYYPFALMLFCGCRPAEATECMGYDIQVKDGVPLLHIRGTKTEKADRYVPIPDRLYQVIKVIPPEEPIGITPRENIKQKFGTRKQAWDAMKKDLNIELGCKVVDGELLPPLPLAPDLVPYNLRHEFCTNLARHGVDIRIAQKLMGHASIQMTANVYTNLQKDDITKVAATLPGVAEGVAEEGRKTNENE